MKKADLTIKDLQIVEGFIRLVGLMLIAISLLTGNIQLAIGIFIGYWIGAAVGWFGALAQEKRTDQ
jgi:hypothetical protein